MSSLSRIGMSAAVAGYLALVMTGCKQHDRAGDDRGAQPAKKAEVSAARARIEGRSGSQLAGEAVFTESAGKVKVLISVAGAPPGLHAVHIHEQGDCSAPDASSAKSHFNPGGHKHGAPGAAEHHAGDFGNMTVNADGSGKLELETSSITVGPGSLSVVGRAIIIHEKPDDFSQPVGNAGGRIGCGEIKG